MKTQITQYTMVKGWSMEELVKQVEKALKDGWVPYFGPIAAYDYFYQAMVVKEEVDDE